MNDIHKTANIANAPASPPRISGDASPWRKIVAPLVLLLTGALLGAAIATHVLHTRIQRFRTQPDLVRNRIVEHARKKLDLRADQIEPVTKIIAHRQTRIVEIRKEISGDVLVEFEAMCREVSAVLEPDQARKWQDLTERIRHRHLPAAVTTGSQETSSSRRTP